MCIEEKHNIWLMWMNEDMFFKHVDVRESVEN